MKKRIGLKIFISIIAVIALVIAFLMYQIDYKKTLVLKDSSHDGKYTLIINQIGDAEFPFGASHCTLELKEGNKVLEKVNCDVYDDGANANIGNFNVGWNEDNVTVVISASEQEDETIVLSFEK